MDPDYEEDTSIEDLRQRSRLKRAELERCGTQFCGALLDSEDL